MKAVPIWTDIKNIDLTFAEAYSGSPNIIIERLGIKDDKYMVYRNSLIRHRIVNREK